MMNQFKLMAPPRIVMPLSEVTFEKKGLYKLCKQQSMSSQVQQMSTESTKSQNCTAEMQQQISSGTPS
jgi:hypothetical protein